MSFHILYFQVSLAKRFDSIYTKKDYVLSTLLDPRWKLDVIPEEHRSRAKQMLSELTSAPQATTRDATPSKKRIIDTSAGPQPVSGSDSTPKKGPQSVSGGDSTPKKTHMSALAAMKEKMKTPTRREMTEAELYLQADTISTDSDPLQWWKSNQSSYPTLARFARKYLALPGSTASVERLFSTAGVICTDRRT